MKQYFLFSLIAFFCSLIHVSAQNPNPAKAKKPQLYIDVHHLGSGNVTFDAVAHAHTKDLATQGKYGVSFIKYWVDEKNGDVYCLSSAMDTGSIVQTHREAHGLLPHAIYGVSDGIAAAAGNGNYFLDIHELGAGKVKAADVEKAHQKDLAVQSRYGVNFLNYWVDEKKGLVLCLSQAAESRNVIKTHAEAHGLIPASIVQVKEGN